MSAERLWPQQGRKGGLIDTRWGEAKRGWGLMSLGGFGVISAGSV